MEGKICWCFLMDVTWKLCFIIETSVEIVLWISLCCHFSVKMCFCKWELWWVWAVEGVKVSSLLQTGLRILHNLTTWRHGAVLCSLSWGASIVLQAQGNPRSLCMKLFQHLRRKEGKPCFLYPMAGNLPLNLLEIWIRFVVDHPPSPMFCVAWDFWTSNLYREDGWRHNCT